MGNLFRALLITTAATGAFALALTVVRSRRPAATPAVSSPNASPEVDADAMPSAERDALLEELDAQL